MLLTGELGSENMDGAAEDDNPSAADQSHLPQPLV